MLVLNGKKKNPKTSVEVQKLKMPFSDISKNFLEMATAKKIQNHRNKIQLPKEFTRMLSFFKYKSLKKGFTETSKQKKKLPSALSIRAYHS